MLAVVFQSSIRSIGYSGVADIRAAVHNQPMATQVSAATNQRIPA
jgi:hypothetical protein